MGLSDRLLPGGIVIIIPVGIVAHATRHERAERLADAVGAGFITVDQGGLGPGRNHENCYEWLAEENCPWSVVLEDDASPVKNFRLQLDQVLRAAPTPLVSLYLGRGRPAQYQPSIAQVIANDSHFFLGDELLHHVGVAIRTPLIPGMLKYIRNDLDYYDKKLPIDEAIGRWARSLNMKVSYCHPSIVNHAHELPTVIKRHLSQHKTETGKRGRKVIRKAWAFGSRQNWNSTSIVIPDPIIVSSVD